MQLLLIAVKVIGTMGLILWLSAVLPIGFLIVWTISMVASLSAYGRRILASPGALAELLRK